MLGFDCGSTVSFDEAQLFVTQHYGFVCRYLMPLALKSWKTLKSAEVTHICDAGLKIVSVYENGADNASKGREQGFIDAQNALKAAAEVGQPHGTVIYFAVDFDAQAKHMDAIEEYFKGVRAFLGNRVIVGIYGSYTVIEEMAKRKAADRFWQTYAWSRGKESKHNNILQYDNGPSGQGKDVNGMNVDLDKSFGNEGWWLTVDAANKQIKVLQAQYNATTDEAKHKVIHDQANALRVASGQAVA